MKNTKITKIISVLMSTLLVAAMLTAVGVSASAATPDDADPSYYDIAVTEYIDGAKSAVPSLVSVSTDKVSADSGETITVIVDEQATAESSLVFDYLYFEGEFEIVEGSLDEFITSHDTVVVLKPMSDIYIEANFYDPYYEEPSDPDYYSELPPVSGPDISCDHDGSGKVDYKDKLMDINGDGYFDIMNTDEGFIWIKNVTYTAVPDGADFVRWEFDGDYELISGSLTDPVIVVRPKSIRLSGTAIFADSPALAHKPAEKPEATPDQKPSPAPSDNGNSGSGSATSPKTRDMLPLFAVITLSAVFAGCFAVAKIKEK